MKWWGEWFVRILTWLNDLNWGHDWTDRQVWIKADYSELCKSQTSYNRLNMSCHQHLKKSLKVGALLRKLEGSLMMCGRENGVILENDEDNDGKDDNGEDDMVFSLMEYSSAVSYNMWYIASYWFFCFTSLLVAIAN